MSWIKYMGGVVIVVVFSCSCGSPQRETRKTKAVVRDGAGGGGSVITGNSGSLGVVVSGDSSYSWTCVPSDTGNPNYKTIQTIAPRRLLR